MAELDAERPTFEDLELLTEVSHLLTVLDLDEMLTQVIHLAEKTTGASSSSLILYDGYNIDWARFIDTSGTLQNSEIVSTILDQGFAGWVTRHKQADIVHDTTTDKRWYVVPGEERVVHSALGIPLIFQEQVVALITLHHQQPNHFNDYHLHMMKIIANQVTVAIHNAQVFNRIKARQQQLEAALHAIPDVIMVLDEKGSILLVNNAALPLLLGQEQSGRIEEVIGQRLTAFRQADSALHPVQQIMREIEGSPLHSGTQWSFEVRSERQQKDYQISMTAWEDHARAIVGYVIVMHDVTTLRDLHRFKDEMLRIASHDLRSPLSLIIGYADMISLDTPDPDSPVHQYLEVIRRSTSRMSDLIDELLRVEQIRSSPLELHEEIDLQKLIKVVVVNMRLLAERRSQQFETHIQLDDAPGIVADPVLIRQAMENLIGNAIKYTPEGGKIVVRAYTEKGEFHFIVEDNGIGIPKESLPYLFNSFYRVKHKATENISGTGLGLNLVKTVIERHNGQVWVESEEGTGSRFGFRLPLQMAQK